MRKSRLDHYGNVAVAIHWVSAILIIALLGSGLRAGDEMDPAAKAAFLRVHVPMGIAILLLTLFRILWWWRFDTRPGPTPATPAWQERVARGVHLLLYLLILGMVASGIGMMALSGAAPAVFGAPGAVLPDFHDYAPRVPHGIAARLLMLLLVLHVGAALYHQFVLRDRLLGRMWFGR